MRLYGTERWRRLAKHQLKVEPLCALCLAEGRGPVPARVADHMEPWRGDVNKFWLGKLQSLCMPCHNRHKKNFEKDGFDRAVGADGYPLDPRHPIYRT